MNELLLARGLQQRGNVAPPGQVEWTTPGTHQWIVPEGVYEVSAVVVGPGEASRYVGGANYNRYSGYGGALRYANGIKVQPGQEITVVVGTGVGTTDDKQSSVLGIYAGFYNRHGGPSGSVGYNGGNRHSGSATPGKPVGGDRYRYGGGAAHFFKNGNGTSTTSGYSAIKVGVGRNTQGSSFPDINATPNALYTNPGGGGTLVHLSTGAFRVSRGGHGAVRIIWGENRAFPDLNTADILPDV